MSITVNLDNIEYSDVGIGWYGKVNQNSEKIKTAFSQVSEDGHNHDQTYLKLTDEITASDVTATLNGNATTAQGAINTLYSMINGMAVNASINAIQFEGNSQYSPIMDVLVKLNLPGFGVFNIAYFWDNNPSSSDFTGAKEATGASAYLTFSKPETGWDSSLQQYLHVRAVFTNMANQSGTAFIAHQLVNKYSKDFSVEELAEILGSNIPFQEAMARTLVGMKAFVSDVATQVNNQ